MRAARSKRGTAKRRQRVDNPCGDGKRIQKSEPPIVAEEVGEPNPRDPTEGRGGRVMEPKEGKMTESLNSGSVSTRLQRIAELARKHPERSFRSIHHIIDMELLEEAYRLTRKGGAAGVDGQTAEEYARNLKGNLQALLDRLKTGTYVAPPVRRVHIPKEGGKTRPIGIPTFEDKILQRAVTMALSPIYEQDFEDCSYGFRPGRSAHGAVEALWQATMSMGGGWVVEADIEGFFDNLDRTHLRSFLDRRVTDGVLRRVIHKWLKAGVMEEGAIRHPDTGTPQGGVISPLLANVYLHEVLDVWFERTVKPSLRGRVQLLRYADDFVVVCQRETDANEILAALHGRFEQYGLRLHPDKTRKVRFVRPPRDGGKPRPETFDFLGFTHFWGKSKKGNPVVMRRTASGRLGRALRRLNEWCQANRHRTMAIQHKQLSAKLRGHYSYYGITHNMDALSRVHDRAEAIWRKWLDRRGGKRRMTWARFRNLLVRWSLPPPQVVHSYV